LGGDRHAGDKNVQSDGGGRGDHSGGGAIRRGKGRRVGTGDGGCAGKDSGEAEAHSRRQSGGRPRVGAFSSGGRKRGGGINYGLHTRNKLAGGDSDRGSGDCDGIEIGT